MRRKSIHVSSGTYCSAPAQSERRMMLQMPLTAELTDCCEACFRFDFDMGKKVGRSGEHVTSVAACADAFHQLRLEKRREDVSRALLGDAERGPQFRRGYGTPVAQDV